MLRLDADTSYFTDLLPALVVYSLGLAVTVAPLTATVLADADETDAGIASAINNAIARTAGLLATAAVGAVLASSYAAALDDAVAGPAARAPRRQAQVAARARARDGSRRRPACPPPTARWSQRAVQDAGVETFHLSALIGAAMVALAGLLGGLLLRNPRRPTVAEGCGGGQFSGAPEELALPARERQPAPARA